MDIDEPCTCPRPLADLLDLVPGLDLIGGPAFLAVAAADPAAPGDEPDRILWPIPSEFPHPSGCLVSFSVDPRWEVIGLTYAVRRRGTDARGRPRGPAVSADLVVLLGRDGHAAAVLRHGRRRELLPGLGEGWVADVLSRALGRATPPPEESPAALIDAAWLDELASMCPPGQVRGGPSWSRLARRHPLCGDGPVPTPHTLAARTRSTGLAGWAELASDPDLLMFVFGEPLPPEVGHYITPADWFDVGSYSRWLLDTRPPIRERLRDLLAVLHPEDGVAVFSALAEPPALAAVA